MTLPEPRQAQPGLPTHTERNQRADEALPSSAPPSHLSYPERPSLGSTTQSWQYDPVLAVRPSLGVAPTPPASRRGEDCERKSGPGGLYKGQALDYNPRQVHANCLT